MSILKKKVLSQNLQIKGIQKDSKNIADTKKAVNFKIIKAVNSGTEIIIITTVTPLINDKDLIAS